MRSFLLFALALANLAGVACGQYGLSTTTTDVPFWDYNNITVSVGIQIDSGASQPKSQVLAGADCNPKAAVKTMTSENVVQQGDVVTWTGTYKNASAAPSMYNGNGVPSFCVRVYYEGPVVFNSTKNETINEIFVSFNYTKVFGSGEANFTLDGIGFNASNVTDFRRNDTVVMGLVARRGFPPKDGALPSSYKMGEAFYLCLYATDWNNFKVTQFKNVACSNDGSTRQLAVAVNDTHTFFDPLTESTDPSKVIMMVGDMNKPGSAKMQCLKSVVTAGFFSGSDTSFNCTGSAVTAPAPIGRRRLDGVEGRSLQSLDQAESSFATTFALDTVEYDTLTAGASIVGVGLSIASALLAMIM